MAEEEQNPVDQLIDLFLYAPVGLLYEYQEVIPKLVKRGKSQVQLARVVGKMATNQGGGAEAFTMAAEGMANLMARQLTEIGAAIGLAPPTGGNETPPPAPKLSLVEDPNRQDSARGSDGEEDTPAEVGPTDEAAAPVDEAPILPIARYDELTAKEIVSLLEDLEPDQLARIRDHEEATRARKTVLGKLDRLAP